MSQHTRELIRKADLALADLQTDGGYMQPAQARRFLELMIKESRLLSRIMVVPMRSSRQMVSGMGFQSRILQAASEGTLQPVGDRSKPDFNEVELNAPEMRATVKLTVQQIEDNIEGQNFLPSVQRLMRKRAAFDMEDFVINADTASGDAFLALGDGVRKRVTSNIVDLAGAAVTPADLTEMIKTLPSEHRINRSELRFLTSDNVEEDYRDTLSERATGAGDRFLSDAGPIRKSGVGLVGLSSMPSNLGVGTNQSEIILTHPKNIVMGIWRRIKLETEYVAREQTYYIILSIRMDTNIFQEDAAVKAINVLAA